MLIQTQEEFQGCKQNHNKNASYLHLFLTLYTASETKAFLTQSIYLCVCVCVHAHVLYLHQHEPVDWFSKNMR